MMYHIRLRQQVVPPNAFEKLCAFGLFNLMTCSFAFTFHVALPEICRGKLWIYWTLFAFGLFLYLNALGNFVYALFIDTSVKHVILKPPEEQRLRKLWSYCDVCEILKPPRAHHCYTCGTCILKRDHHCVALATCIGHRNQRYFMCFLLHGCIGSFGVVLFGSIYFYYLHPDVFDNVETYAKMICPFLFLYTEFWKYAYLCVYECNVLLCAIGLLVLHACMSTILEGSTYIKSRRRNEVNYDLGWRRNLVMAFGKRYYLVWLFPTIESDLPMDGIHWERVYMEMLKNR